ncbi:acyl-CoA synthetase [Oceanibacterium hippocampi]|uniref:3-methylmercaptopropionyl-CoA ligase n=1 Tax=Oceanibacterium hippocampi TaxID=745714 RepID=A0A1Y5TVX3_9PROT|nr:acyl-CoA synthetase [Oceanibacterium hippocampi]SLN74288.1 Long-chain-fatty-acid--CoA ligase [Oceanibacterium hippocampi]
MTASAYETDLGQNPANYEPLSPLTFLKRSAAVFPDRVAVIHGPERYTYRETYARARRLASALAAHGIGRDDTVAIMLPNVPQMVEVHFGVPMCGAVLNTLNTRLDAKILGFILNHADAKVLITDTEFSPVIREALEIAERDILVIDVVDPQGPGGDQLGATDYESFIAGGDPDYDWRPTDDEWRAISLNYTSGTTGNPKGVVYHHRGAYLNALGNAVTWGIGRHATYLWTLPMFHCNGWCFPWTIVALAGTHVCLRRVEAKPIFEAIEAHGVTHFSGAPVVLSLLINASDELKAKARPGVKIMTAAAAPPPPVLAAMEEMGFDVTHVYGLTETYGPAVVCEWKGEWDDRPLDERARLKSRQGVRYQVLEGITVKDPATMEDVPADGATMGEIMMRGNIVMKGYLKNPKATAEAFEGGWFHSGDLAVMHPDGYVEIRDRSKDIIISGGENISTIEVEGVLYKHPAVLEAAVVARPDQKWGETPCAFVTLKPNGTATAEEIIAFCRDNLAHYKCPRTVVFGDLPKTSTGKVQKFVLRDKARAL